jgi:hypothetical protein
VRDEAASASTSASLILIIGDAYDHEQGTKESQSLTLDVRSIISTVGGDKERCTSNSESYVTCLRLDVHWIWYLILGGCGNFLSALFVPSVSAGLESAHCPLLTL